MTVKELRTLPDNRVPGFCAQCGGMADAVGTMSICAECGYEVPREALIYAAAPDLYAALREAHDALRDIINAAGNDDPYTREELEGEFSEISGNAWAALAKAEGREA